MATVFVVTAGSGDSYRIERVYLDSDQAYRFAQDYNGIEPTEPVHVEEWEPGDPPAEYDGPYWRAQWWARVPAAKRRSMLRDTDEGDRFDDYAIRQEWWTGEACPRPSWETGRGAQDRGGRALQGEGAGGLLGGGHAGQGRVGRCSTEIISTVSCVRRKETGIIARHCRPDAS